MTLLITVCPLLVSFIDTDEKFEPCLKKPPASRRRRRAVIEKRPATDSSDDDGFSSNHTIDRRSRYIK